ncbi:MAG: orotidine-5'-phosphate decarboxylase [Candidatus Omnitrophota bacterium]
MKRTPELIVALDVDSLQKAKDLVNLLSSKVKIFKVGSQLFTSCGPEIIKFIRQKKAEVFLDLKYFDIPNTVANAVYSASRLRVKMLTLHAQGGEEMLKLARRAAKKEARRLKIKPPLLIAVTVLTSQKTTPQVVLRLAKEALKCRLDGIVCSAKEARFLRKSIKKGFLIITPGIRPTNAAVDDQKRTATVQEAITAGADYIVVGRPILKAREPLLAAKEILAEIKG